MPKKCTDAQSISFIISMCVSLYWMIMAVKISCDCDDNDDDYFFNVMTMMMRTLSLVEESPSVDCSAPESIGCH